MRRPVYLRTTLPFTCVPPNSIGSTHTKRCSNGLGTGGTGTSQKQKVNFWQMDSDSGFQKKSLSLDPVTPVSIQKHGLSSRIQFLATGRQLNCQLRSGHSTTASTVGNVATIWHAAISALGQEQLFASGCLVAGKLLEWQMQRDDWQQGQVPGFHNLLAD